MYFSCIFLLLTMKISGVVEFFYVGYTCEDTVGNLYSGIATADRVDFEQRPGRKKNIKEFKGMFVRTKCTVTLNHELLSKRLNLSNIAELNRN